MESFASAMSGFEPAVTGSVKMNGHFNFHYDENLGKLQTGRGFIVTSWNEL